MVALLAALLIRQTPAALSFDVPACRIEVLAETIGKAANTHLEIAPNLKGEIVAIRVKNVTLDDLLAKIGKTMWAKWVPVEGGLRLEQPQELRVLEERQDRKIRLQAIRETIASQRKALAKSAPLTNGELALAKEQYRKVLAQASQAAQDEQSEQPTEADSAAMEKAQSHSPTSRLLLALAASLDPDTLADMADGERVVYSSAPTPMQRSLTGAGASIVQGFVAEQNRLAAVLASVPKPAPPTRDDGNNVATMSWQNGGDTPFGSSKPITDLGKVLIAVKNTGPSDFQINVMVVGRDGSIQFEGNGGLGSNATSSDPDPGNDKPDAPVKPDPADKDLIPLSPNTVENLDMLRTVNPQQQAPADGQVMFVDSISSVSSQMHLPPKLADRLRDPFGTEPLALCWSDLVLGSEPSKNVVARLPDDMFDIGEVPVDTDRPTVKMARDWLENQGSLDRDEADGWVTLTPTMSLRVRRDRCDRAKLREYIAASERGNLGIDGYADIAKGLPDPGSNNYMRMAELYGDQPGVYFGVNNSDWSWWQLYAQLPPLQRQAVKIGAPIAVGSLPLPARNLLNQIVYWTPAELGAPNAAVYSGFMVFTTAVELDGTQDGSRAPEIMREPTEALPNGIAGSAILKGNLSAETVALAPDGGSLSSMMGAMGPEQLALMGSGVFDHGSGTTVLDTTKLRKGTRESLLLTLEFRPKLAVQSSLTRARMEKGTVSLDTFPEDFRTRFEAMRKSTSQWHFQIGGPQHQAPPPPP